MFLSGADGTTPELRPPSIKGALRFWWRAMNGHLDLKTLKEQESLIFGGTDGESGRRSRVIIRAKPLDMQIEQAMLVPHKTNMPPQKSFKPKQNFEVTLGLISNTVFTFAQLQALFELVCVLGGFGKRSRRGMGSVRIMKTKMGDVETGYKEVENLEQILSLLVKLSPYYSINDNRINNNFAGRMELSPWIKSVQIGKHRPNITKVISHTTHIIKEKDNAKYEPSLGHAFKGRFASPIYVSVLEGTQKERAIITTLNTVPDRGRNQIDKLVQEEFKSKIL